MKTKIIKTLTFLLLIVSFLFLNACGSLNLFSIADDKSLGLRVDGQIESDPATYPVLSESDYPEAYDYLKDIRDDILNSGSIQYADEFEWEVHIIHDDSILNAFAVPGGYLYFYTGLIKYLETEDSFAGVVGHEIAHADRRHTTESLTREYGISLLLDVTLGDRLDILQNIAQGLTSLSFSRENESEADDYSVNYLSETAYQCNGAARFFEKLIEDDAAGNTPEFLSTHPDPENRVEDINAKAEELGCDTTPSDIDYQAFKDMLP